MEQWASGAFGMEDIAEIQAEAAGTVDKTAASTLTLGERFSLLANSLVTKLNPIIEKVLRLLEEWIPVLIEVIENVAEHLTPAFEFLAEKVLPPLMAFVKDTLIPAWQDIARDVFPEIEKVMKDVVFPIFKWLVEDALPPVIEVLKFVIPIAVTVLVEAIRLGFNLIKGVIDGASATWDALVGSWNWIVDRATWLKDTVVGVFNDIWSGIRSVVNSVLGGIESFVNGIASGIDTVSGLLSKIPGVDIPQVPQLNLPRLAEGGVVRAPTLAMIGESGPEAVVPLDRSGYGTTVNVYIENAFGDDMGEIYRRAATEVASRGLQ